MSGMVHTVLGEMEPQKLSFTQCHEHLMLIKGESYRCNPALCIDDLEKSIQEVEAYRRAGGGAIVEAQPVGCNRDSESLAVISRRTEVPIVASTGFHKMQFYPANHWIRSRTEEELRRLFVSELTEGMYMGMDEGFRPRQHAACAGILKTALDTVNLREPYSRLFGAAADVQMETGAPMMVHIEKGSSPVILAEFLKRKGVNPERVYFCHLDRACEDRDIFWRILDMGISLEFDTIGRFKYHSDEYELELIKDVLDRGYEAQLLFSLDTTRERMKAYNPEGIGLDYILRTFIPAMRAEGISEKQMEKIGRINPQRILAW